MGKIQTRPSEVARSIACPPSMVLDRVEQEDSEYAKLGTAAHHLAEACFVLGLCADCFIGHEVEGVVVNGEMAKYVQSFLDVCSQIKSELEGPLDKQFSELRLEGEIRGVSIGGTIDRVYYTGTELAIIDLKYGEGVVVNAIDNPQLLTYAALALDHFSKLYSGYPVPKVKLVIHQPRIKKEPTIFEPADEEIVEHIARLTAAIETAERYQRDREGSLVVAGDHCRWCPCKAACPRIQEDGDRVVQLLAGRDFSQLVKTTSTQDLADVFDKKTAVNEFFKLVEAELRDRSLAGEEVGGYKVVEGLGHRKIVLDEDELRAYMKRKGYKVSDYTSKRVKTLTELDKVIKKRHMEEITTRAALGPKLVPETDRREAITAVAKLLED